MKFTNNSKILSTKILDKMMRLASSYSRGLLRPALFNNIVVDFNDGGDSYCQVTGQNSMSIVIGTGHITETINASFADKKDLHLLVEGVLYHEIAHAVFTDFKLVNSHLTGMHAKNQEMVNLVSDYVEESSIIIKNQLKEKIEKLIENFYFASQISYLQNVLEDGFIENQVKATSRRASLSVYEQRKAMTLQSSKAREELGDAWNVGREEYYRSVMTEIYLQATGGLETSLYTDSILGDGFTQVLSNYATEKEANEIILLCSYTRFNATHSKDVAAATFIIADTLKRLYFDYVQEGFVEAKFQEMCNNYNSLKDFLDNEQEQLMSDMSPDNGSSEDSFIPPSLSASNSSSASAGGNVYIPEQLQDKLKEKYENEVKEMEGKEKEKSEEGSEESGDESGDESSQEGESSESEDGNSESSEQGQEEGSEQGDSSDSSSENSDSSGNSEDAEGSNSSSEAGDSDSKELTEAEAEQKQKELEEVREAVKDAQEKSKAQENMESLESKAQKAKDLEDEIKAKEKSLRSEESSKIQEDVKNAQQSGEGKKPESVKGNSLDGAGFNNISTRFIRPEITQGVHPSLLSSLRTQANRISIPLRALLMRNSKSKKEIGLKRGTSINGPSIINTKTDRRIFKRVKEGVKSKARIGIVIDCSGSMMGSNMEEAKKAAFVLSTTLSKIKVPHQIWGHSTNRDVVIYDVLSFEESLRPNNTEHIWNLSAGGGNHDSEPIYRMLTELASKKQKDESLFLWVISDGSPAGLSNYYGEAAEKDIKAIYKRFEKMYDIHTTGIGISGGLESVGRIYEDCVLVDNVEELGSELINSLRKTLGV